MKKIFSSLCALLFLFSACNSEDAVFLEKVKKSNELATSWLLNNMRDKGLFRYIYKPDTQTYPNSNNAIRQLMASRLLAELSSTDDLLKEMHRKNLNFLFTNWYKEEEKSGETIGYIFYDNNSKLGANAMMLRTLSFSPFFEEYKVQAERLARGIISLMAEDGSFSPFYKEPAYQYDKDYLLTFYSGEALLSLVDYYLKVQDDFYLQKIILSQDFYIDRYVTHLSEHYYPAYVPWHTQSLSRLYFLTGEQKYAEAIFALNNELLKIQDTKEFIGRFYNPQFPQYGSPHSASDGVYTEGLAYAYEIAKAERKDQLAAKYKEALRIGVDNLISLQYEDSGGAGKTYMERLRGAFRYKVGDNRIRIDTTQHTIDAYRKILEVF